MKRLVLILVMILASGAAFSVQAQDDETGTLVFRANGEDFVRQGFVSKDGWEIAFDHVYVNLTGITAYQTEPPFDAQDEDAELSTVETVALEDTYLLDLAEGDADADLIPVDSVEAVPAGRYNALGWQMVNVDDEESDYNGYTLVMMGTATQDEETVEFTVKIENEYEYICGEYVGDERKGILVPDGEAEMELTFHFDHIFGDAEAPLDDGLNVTAPGFDPFAVIAEDGVLDADLEMLETLLSEEDYTMLVDILPSLGHVGEGHCQETTIDDEMMDDMTDEDDAPEMEATETSKDE